MTYTDEQLEAMADKSGIPLDVVRMIDILIHPADMPRVLTNALGLLSVEDYDNLTMLAAGMSDFKAFDTLDDIEEKRKVKFPYLPPEDVIDCEASDA